MTPEEIAESQATWQEQRDAANAEKNACADQLTQEQRDAIEFAYKASEWKLRSAFPAIAEGS
jgi:hypothetical protein